MPTLHSQMFHISRVLRYFRKCEKMRTFESERIMAERSVYRYLALFNSTGSVNPKEHNSGTIG